jgi:hypothetical protein
MGLLVTFAWLADEGWMQIDWTIVLGWYFGIGAVIGALAAIALFFWCWWYGANEYGAAGFLFGWIPGGVLGLVAGAVVVPLWGVGVLGLIIIANRDWPPKLRLRARRHPIDEAERSQ